MIYALDELLEFKRARERGALPKVDLPNWMKTE